MSDQNTPPSKETRATAVRRLVFRIISFLAGAAILFHEVTISRDSEPILDLIALYLMGLPIADLTAHMVELLGFSFRSKDDESKR